MLIQAPLMSPRFVLLVNYLHVESTRSETTTRYHTRIRTRTREGREENAKMRDNDKEVWTAVSNEIILGVISTINRQH